MVSTVSIKQSGRWFASTTIFTFHIQIYSDPLPTNASHLSTRSKSSSCLERFSSKALA